jgi:hypothetical protein
VAWKASDRRRLRILENRIPRTGWFAGTGKRAAMRAVQRLSHIPEKHYIILR